MKKSKKVLLITFIVVLFLFIVGKIIIGNMVRNVQNISVSMPIIVLQNSNIGYPMIAD